MIKTRAAIYTRISQDRDGERAGVERQRVDLVKLCEERGFTWSEDLVFEDNNRSAFGAKERPAWIRMLAAAADGQFDVLVAWHDDRLWRDVVEQQGVFRLLAEYGIKRIITPGRDYDTSSGDDQFFSGIGALAAQYESARKRARLVAEVASRAQQGKHHGGHRLFGYTSDKSAVIEDEAELLRDAAARVIQGESASSICREWNAAGVTTVGGTPWRGNRLRNILRNPAVTGLRVHRGEVVGEAKWPPVLDRATWEAVQHAMASTPEARRSGPPRRYLLSGGLLRCAICDAPVHSRPRDSGVRGYLCIKRDAQDVTRTYGCGGVKVAAEPVEQFVIDAVFAAVDDGALTQIRDADSGSGDDEDLRQLVADLRDAERKLAQAEERYLLGDVSRRAYLAVKSRLAADLDELRRRLARGQSRALQEDLPAAPDELRAWFEDASIDRKRAFLRLFIEKVSLKKASRRGEPFSPGRIDIVWVA